MSNQFRFIATMIYAAIVAVLAISDVSWMPWFAAVGGVLIGLMWVLAKSKQTAE